MNSNDIISFVIPLGVAAASGIGFASIFSNAISENLKKDLKNQYKIETDSLRKENKDIIENALKEIKDEKKEMIIQITTLGSNFTNYGLEFHSTFKELKNDIQSLRDEMRSDNLKMRDDVREATALKERVESYMSILTNQMESLTKRFDTAILNFPKRSTDENNKI